MAKRSASSARARRVAKKNLAIPESRIDYSDIPPISREQLRRMKRVGDPVRVWASPNKNPTDNRVRLKRIERTSDGWKWQGNRGAVR